MRVLHLPLNIASQMSTLVCGLRELGVDARGIAHGPSVLNDSAGIDVHDPSTASTPVGRRAAQLNFQRAVLQGIAWADVVHWHGHSPAVPFALDLRLAARLRKPRVVQFHGTDIRIPEVARRDNPYIGQLLDQGAAAYPITREGSRRTQRTFARHGFACLLAGPELALYREPDIFDRHFSTEVAVDASRYRPVYPDAGDAVPKVVHLPSHTGIKGTEYVLKAIADVRAQRRVDFRLIQGMPHARAMELVRGADIVLDQFCVGIFGVAAVEGMAFGKPTLSYLPPTVAERLGPDSPLLNASPRDLSSLLIALLDDGERRRDLGIRGRRYVEQVHDARAVAGRLIRDVYQPLMTSTRR